MTITLPRKVAKGRQVTVVIAYDGVPLEAKKAPWDGGFVWAKTPDGQPWIATAVQGEGCDLFWPCIDYPTGEPKLVDLHITVPAPLVAPANGVFKGMTEKDGWRTYNWEAKNPNTYAIALDVVGIVIAALFLISDFSVIDECVQEQYPKEYEWSAAFGLVFTVIWLYLKILDLLMQLNKKND